MSETCETCRFWGDHGQVDGWAAFARCRRFPPMPKADGRSEGYVFPATPERQWCGEYQPTPTQPKETT